MSIENESAFDKLVSQRGAPGEGFDFDMSVRVPRAAELRDEAMRRKQEAREAEDAKERELRESDEALAQAHGQRGGGDEGGGASAPEAAPQTDEIDDGEHTESVVAAAVAEEPEQPAGRPQEAPQAPERAQAAPEAQEGSERAAEAATEPQEAEAGPRPRAETAQEAVEGGFDRNVGFKHAGETVQLGKFPKALITAIADRLKALSGGQETPYNAPLVTGYLLASLGLDPSGYDANTRLVAQLFAAGESPRLGAIEEALGELSGMLGRLGAGQRSQTKALKETVEAVEAVSLAQAYLLSDRLEGIGKDVTSGAAADLQGKQPTATLENMRRTARQRIKDRDISEGRAIR